MLVLADDPHPANSRKLEGYHDLYRLRVGDWRIIYQVDKDQLLILVLEVGSRGEIYRGY
jgi:mRNA interferase RelE/StbE